MIAPLRHRSLLAVPALLCLLLALVPAARGEEPDDTLGMFTAWQGETSTAARAPKPLSHTAENVTVISRREIEALNAHTLGDVLETVPGVQTIRYGGPGGLTTTYLQSSQFRHVLVMVDGIPINNSETAVVNTVPAQIIERVEIVKGAATSSWGQALAGVINVVTREPTGSRTVTGEAVASLGERATSDSRGELSGTVGLTGYYLAGGYLRSDGLQPDTWLKSYNVYAKLTHELPGTGRIWGTVRYSGSGGGLFSAPIVDGKDTLWMHELNASLGLQQQLTDRLELGLLVRHHAQYDYQTLNQLSDNTFLFDLRSSYRASGGNATLTWKGSNQLLVGGMDYEHIAWSATRPFFAVPDTLAGSIDRFGLFINDTVDLGSVSIIPGLRYDHTEAGDQWNPSLGVAWRLGEDTVARGYTGRGHSLATLLLDRGPEQIWTSQIGIETSLIPSLWLKGTLFRNETWDIQAFDQNGVAHPERQLALGGEIEARTVPLFHSSLETGYTFTDTTRTADGSQVLDSPRHTVKLALRYDDGTFRGLLTGRHVWWNADPTFSGRYNGLLWDLFLGAKVLQRDPYAVELFFSGHNLFDTFQHPDPFPVNTGRWFEGGMKVRF